MSVTTTRSVGKYLVSAIVTDAKTSKVLASPAILVNAGTPAAFEIGMNPGTVLRFTVTVDANGQMAAYRGETLKNGEVESGHTGELHVSHRRA